MEAWEPVVPHSPPVIADRGPGDVMKRGEVAPIPSMRLPPSGSEGATNAMQTRRRRLQLEYAQMANAPARDRL